MMILFFCGSTGGFWLRGSLTGRSTFTACVGIGRVMMNMMRSTSMTSINGVVFMSIIGSPSSEPPLIAMSNTPGSGGADQPPAGGGCEMKPTLAKPACCIV
ncbi:hypothetical protein WR25_23458 [Diploscapter pachys]|uniref:Uncharacterized protein n=1 Tax=Diploscapter pachys TaxID=2018661 RepID=A0A2A2KIL8_9BILA|nr:hypothetical protein WR25_23458 [Diploscapter pachys]